MEITLELKMDSAQLFALMNTVKKKSKVIQSGLTADEKAEFVAASNAFSEAVIAAMPEQQLREFHVESTRVSAETQVAGLAITPRNLA